MKETRKKETAFNYWFEMIKKSWTWNVLTEREKNCFMSNATTSKTVSGTFEQRWNALNDLYNLFTEAIEAGTGEILLERQERKKRG